MGNKSHPSDFLLPPYGENFLGVLLSKKEVREVVGSIFERFDLNLALDPINNVVEIFKIRDGIVIKFNPELISDSLKRTAFIFTVLLSNESSLIAIEEPESHTFPYYIKQIAEFIADDKTNQFMISTHNPYFLLTIIEKTKKEDIKVFITRWEKDQTVIYEASKDKLDELLSMDIDIFFNIDKLV